MDQELFTLLEYVQQNSVIPTGEPEIEKRFDVTSVNNISAQQNIPEMYSAANVSQPVETNFYESFQELFSLDYDTDHVPFYEDPTLVESYTHDTAVVNLQNDYSTGNIDRMPAEQNPSTAELSAYLYEPSTGATETYRCHYYYSTFQSTECSSRDEYISCDFTKPPADTTHSLIGFVTNDNLEQSVQKDHHKQIPTSAPKLTNDEPSDQSNVALSTEFDKLQSAAATKTPLVSAGVPKKPTQTKVRKPALKPAVVSEWRCVPCDRMFRIERGLLQHNLYFHSGVKPYSCNVCGKRYHDQQTTLQHQRRHAAVDKPFKCEKCTRQYHHPYDLKRHIDLHHGVARYNCRYCGKAFGRADHVKLHETSHDNGTVKRKRKN
ncbi:zinc finger protein 69 homolog B-like [Ochlerotatus camptorhynchus]|uniref:zinc finger protein 69 homolog B-like n=1 Tax=Ochlerotatus camptorhynchus TaxID=644619 RepID=UPI0031DF7E13